MQPKTDSSTPALRWGILGYGGHAQKKMLPAFDKSECAELVAVGTRGEEKAAALTSRHPGVRIHPSYEALLDDPEVQAVYIGLPNHLHSAWTIRCLESGKHVLCDKPIALTAAEAQAIKAAADKTGAKYMEAFMYRFHPQQQRVRELLAAGAIGTVRLFEGHFHFSLNDFSNIRLQPDTGGGGLLDVGCYLVDSTRFILQAMPEEVSAIWHIGTESGVDEFLTCQLRYANGIAAHLTCGCRFGWSNQYTVYGDNGKLTLPSAYTIPWNKTGRIEVQLTGDDVQIHQVPPANYFIEELNQFAAWIAGRPVNAELFGDGLENLTILDAIRESASSRSAVSINR